MKALSNTRRKKRVWLGGTRWGDVAALTGRLHRPTGSQQLWGCSVGRSWDTSPRASTPGCWKHPQEGHAGIPPTLLPPANP